jgi:hypothetical protein
MSEEQQFHKGDLVRVAHDLGPTMSHFKADCDAIIMGSYADQYGGSDRHSYTLYLKGDGETSWYDACQLTLIEHGRLDLLEEWRAEAEAERVKHSDLDWIFAHGAEILKREAPGSSLQALASCLGISSLWPSGEGYEYLSNALALIDMARPFLKSGDKSEWIKFCEELKVEEGRS